MIDKLRYQVDTKDVAPIVLLQAVTKHYVSAGSTVPVLRGIDLNVLSGETLMLKGVSGSGKSTLLNVIGAIDKPTSGSVRVCGEELSALDFKGQTAFRAHCLGFVFQFFNLIPTLTARENVMAALDPLGGSRRARDRAATLALEAVGLGEHVNKYPSQLSGGQQQRVAIARAMAKRPTLILADEPTGALDNVTAHQVLQCLKDMQSETGCSLIISTHDHIVSQYADRVYRLEDGQLVEET